LGFKRDESLLRVAEWQGWNPGTTTAAIVFIARDVVLTSAKIYSYEINMYFFVENNDIMRFNHINQKTGISRIFSLHPEKYRFFIL
jgi:hypothetical protein